MIYTVTLNPSLDLSVLLENFNEGGINYSQSDDMLASGHAINISQILRRLNVPTLATGFVGGKTGAFIEEELEKHDIPRDFIQIEGTTRINLNIFDQNVETRILGKGPQVTIQEINALLFFLSRVREGDIIIVAGSLPPNAQISLYERIIEIAIVNKAMFIPVVPPHLIEYLDERPLLIAPDRKELSEMFNVNLTTKEEIISHALRCMDMGVQNMIVSLGIEGSLFISKDREMVEAKGPDRTIISSNYTDIAPVAGFVGQYMMKGNPIESFKMAQAVTNATYYVKGLPSKEEIDSEFKRVEILPIH